MSTTTSHLGLTKPSALEYPDISVINANYDLIDAACAAGENKLAVTDNTSTAAHATSVGQLTFKDNSLWKGLDEVRLYNGTDALYCKEGVATGLLMQNDQIKVVPVTWNAGVPAVGTVKGYIDANGDYHSCNSTGADKYTLNTLGDSVSNIGTLVSDSVTNVNIASKTVVPVCSVNITAGKWIIIGNGNFVGSFSDEVSTGIQDGTNEIAVVRNTGFYGGSNNVSAIANVNAAKTIRLTVYQDSSSAQVIARANLMAIRIA